MYIINIIFKLFCLSAGLTIANWSIFIGIDCINKHNPNKVTDVFGNLFCFFFATAIILSIVLFFVIIICVLFNIIV